MTNRFKENVLISATNWLGDTIMSMPAVQVFKRRNPDSAVCLLVKKNLIPVWQMHGSIDYIVQLDEGIEGTLATSVRLRRLSCARAFVLSNSIRSALVPAAAGITPRIGLPGHDRSLLLTKVIPDGQAHADVHQSIEYADILGLNRNEVAEEPPAIRIPTESETSAFAKAGISTGTLYLTVMPGAAYGPVKQWLPEYFVETAKALADKYDCKTLVLGARNESALCDRIASSIGLRAVSLAGKTSLPELSALLSKSLVVISNDSGGMHLASACGTKLVAVFGITDPVKTGPLGRLCRIMKAEGVKGRREIGRDDPEGISALKSIRPHAVIKAAEELIDV